MRDRRICCLTNLEMTPLSLGNVIFLKEKGGMRESVPRQIDRESRGPQRREGSGILKEEERTNFFSFSTVLRII